MIKFVLWFAIVVPGQQQPIVHQEEMSNFADCQFAAHSMLEQVYEAMRDGKTMARTIEIACILIDERTPS